MLFSWLWMSIRGVGGKCTSLHCVLLLDKAFMYSKEAIVRLHHKALMREGAGAAGSHDTSSIMICTSCFSTVIPHSPCSASCYKCGSFAMQHVLLLCLKPITFSYCSVRASAKDCTMYVYRLAVLPIEGQDIQR